MLVAPLIKKQTKMLIFFGVVFGLLSAALSFALPMEYRADAQVLILAPTQSVVDPYAAVKSAERIGENVAQVVKTNDFFQKVVGQESYGLDTSAFNNVPERIKRKRWQKAIEASVSYGTSVLTISTYHKNQEQAGKFAGASLQSLLQYGREYVGTGVTMKVVNDPVVTRFPARPNALVNGLIGFVVGVVLGALRVVKKNKYASV